STTTLAWGVNLPSHCVIIKNTKIYSSEISSFIDLDILDVLQIFGRAARPQYHNSGHGILMCSQKSFSRYAKELASQFPLESSFQQSLSDFLNAEISAGNICNMSEALQWIKNTFYCIRMERQPRLYGIMANNTL
ncbi:MAG: activating signal cointegrator 1 complex subunit, partial [Paramarteilia canceri]